MVAFVDENILVIHTLALGEMQWRVFWTSPFYSCNVHTGWLTGKAYWIIKDETDKMRMRLFRVPFISVSVKARDKPEQVTCTKLVFIKMCSQYIRGDFLNSPIISAFNLFACMLIFLSLIYITFRKIKVFFLGFFYCDQIYIIWYLLP